MSIQPRSCRAERQRPRHLAPVNVSSCDRRRDKTQVPEPNRSRRAATNAGVSASLKADMDIAGAGHVLAVLAQPLRAVAPSSPIRGRGASGMSQLGLNRTARHTVDVSRLAGVKAPGTSQLLRLQEPAHWLEEQVSLSGLLWRPASTLRQANSGFEPDSHFIPPHPRSAHGHRPGPSSTRRQAESRTSWIPSGPTDGPDPTRSCLSCPPTGPELLRRA